MKLVDHLLCFDEMIQEEKAIVEVFISYGNTRTEAEKMSQDSRDTLKLIKQDLSKSLLINKTFSLLLIRECGTFDADLGPWYRMPEDWTNGDAVRSLFKTMTAKETVLSSVLSVRDAKIPIKLCAEFQEKLDKIVAAMEQESQALLRGYPAAGGIKGEIRMLKKGWKPSWSMSPWPLDPLKKLSFAKSFGTDCDCVTDEWLTLAVRSGKCSQLTFLELRNCTNITDAGIKVIAQSCKSLNTIDLHGCYLLTNTSLKMLCSGCPQLLQVSITQSQVVKVHSKKKKNIKIRDEKRDSGRLSDSSDDLQYFGQVYLNPQKKSDKDKARYVKEMESYVPPESINQASIDALLATYPKLNIVHVEPIYEGDLEIKIQFTVDKFTFTFDFREGAAGHHTYQDIIDIARKKYNVDTHAPGEIEYVKAGLLRNEYEEVNLTDQVGALIPLPFGGDCGKPKVWVVVYSEKEFSLT
jgi:hypothetical protein